MAKSMELVERIEKNEFLPSNFGIYELDDYLTERYGGRYALLQGILYDGLITETTPYEKIYEILDKLSRATYEGFFVTKKEAFYQVKLVELQSKNRRLERLINDLYKLKNIEPEPWYDVM